MTQDIIQKVTLEIENLKSKNKKYWYDFNVNKQDSKKLKEYFENIGYKVELKECRACKLFDIIIEF